MKKLTTIILLTLLSAAVQAQLIDANGNLNFDSLNTEDLSQIVYPEFTDSLDFGKIIGDRMHLSPEAKANKVTGVIKVCFKVDRDGNLFNVKTVGDSLGYGLEQAAIKAVESTSGFWKPGTFKGEKVILSRSLPLRIKFD